MNIELTDKEFRRLLDLVYIGNWILNSTREKDRFEDYDILQEKLFAQCAKNGMNALISRWQGHIFPSPAYENGGIHEAIADYEDAVFFDILAEELARRDAAHAAELAALRETHARDIAALQAALDDARAAGTQRADELRAALAQHERACADRVAPADFAAAQRRVGELERAVREQVTLQHVAEKQLVRTAAQLDALQAECARVLGAPGDADATAPGGLQDLTL